MRVKQLYVEYRENYLGLDIKLPRFSWKIESQDRDFIQKAYRIQVANDEEFTNLYWDTERVESEDGIQIEYAGKDIKSTTRYYVRVMVWDEYDRESEWSDCIFFETSFLTANRWDAAWIRPGWERTEDCYESVAYLRKEFNTGKKIKQARLYATAQGMYVFYINGKRVGDAYFAPYWTDYKERLQYQTYDVTELLSEDNNAIGAMLGDGWYLGALTWEKLRNIYGTDQCLLAELIITYEDGTKETIITDTNWKCSKGPVLMSSIYDGEDYDARLEAEGWNSSGFDDSKWVNALPGVKQKGRMIACEGEAVVPHERLKPVVLGTPSGEKILDFGQNMVGIIEIEIDQPAGTEIHIETGEVLDKAGNFYNENYRNARSAINYTAAAGKRVYSPTFTFFGFRYLRVKGWQGELNPENFTGVVLHSDFKQTGHFETSEPLLNQLHHNIIWGQKGNFVDVPTDCPQRDERLGWTGDAQAFASTACFNMDVANFYTKYAHDVASEQGINGSIPYVVPNVLEDGAESATGWADVVTILPWEMYVTYGDKRLLEDMYPAMKSWVEHMRRRDEEWRRNFHFGDWLALDNHTRNDFAGGTNERYIAWAFQIYSTMITMKAARVLGYLEDVQRYRDLHMELIDGFQNEFVTPAGRLSVTTQTAHVLALFFNLLDSKGKSKVAEKLVGAIRAKDTHLETGFLGTPYLNFVLTASGYNDVAYELLMKKDYPSWLYQVECGATTIWEHWDGILPDGSLLPPSMNSYNHYAYGAIGSWMYKTITGINSDEKYPAYKRSIIHPKVGGNLTYAEGRLETMYGEVACGWTIDDDKFNVKVTIPANTSSCLILENIDLPSLVEGGQPAKDRKGIRDIRQTDEGVKIELGSGIYEFSAKRKGE